MIYVEPAEVCGQCGNSRAEARALGPWRHRHTWVAWTGTTEFVSVSQPRGTVANLVARRTSGR